MATTLKEQYDKLSTDFRWGVAIDGSTMALKALKLAIKLMQERHGEGTKPTVEKVHVLHVENPRKQDAISLKSSHFRNSAKLIFDTETFVEMKWHQSLHSATNENGIFAQLECMARDNKVNLLVVGTFGLNGEKKNKIGRMTQFSMANSQTPVMIVKPTYKITDEPRSFLVAVDGQGASNRALLFALKYIVRKTDKIILFYKNSVDETKGFFDPYVKVLEALDVGYETKFSSDKSMNVAAEIVHIASELQTEFIVMGKKRTRQEVLLGSISDHVAARTRSSLIICKDIAFE